MKTNLLFPRNSIILTLLMMLFFALEIAAQEAFKVKWTMDDTQVGVSNHANFTPANAVLAGGTNTMALNASYGSGGAIGTAYVVRPWPTVFSSGRYMQFTFTANSFKYNITEISFRLKRSPDGPKQVKVRTSMDGFASDFTTASLSGSVQFYPQTVPAGFNNLLEKTFSVRIYGYASNNIYGTLWLDEIIINGEVLAIVLPLDLTFVKAKTKDQNVHVSWETAWERNTAKFYIERSSDLQTFETIGEVTAMGETRKRTAYAFVDEVPLPGVGYYRLRMIDLDGRFSYSNFTNVTFFQEHYVFKVVPNPASATKIFISGSGIDPAFLQLSDMAGLRIWIRYEIDAAGFIALYPASPLSPGLYFLSYQKNGRKEHAKVLVP